MGSVLCVNTKLQGSWYSCCRGILIIALIYWGALWTCTIKVMHHHPLRWWGQTSAEEVLQGQTDHAAEAVWQSVSIRTRSPAHSSLLCSWSSSACPALPCLFNWQKNGLAEKGKFLCQFNELNYLTDSGWMREGRIMCRRDLHSLLQWQRQQVVKLSYLSAPYNLIFEPLTAQKWSTEILYFLSMCSSSASFKYVPESLTVLVDIVSTELRAVLKEIKHCIYS